MRLATLAAGEWCPGGGWQFPFDFGNRIIAPTYTAVQSMHIWRREVMLSAIDRLIPRERRERVPILDLGGGEGAMAIGHWRLGFRDITLVEIRPLNIEKARFVANLFKTEINIQSSTIEDFLQANTKRYDIMLFMGLLYHLLNPIDTLELIGKHTSRYMVLETAMSVPKLKGFKIRAGYAPIDAAFFIRIDSSKSHTAGLSGLELWPNMAAVNVLVQYAGFRQLTPLEGKDPPPDFASNSRLIALASK